MTNGVDLSFQTVYYFSLLFELLEESLKLLEFLILAGELSLQSFVFLLQLLYFSLVVFFLLLEQHDPRPFLILHNSKPLIEERFAGILLFRFSRVLHDPLLFLKIPPLLAQFLRFPLKLLN